MHAVAISPPVPHVRIPATVTVPTRRIGRIPGLARLREIVRQSRRHGIWIVMWSLMGWIGTALAPVLSDQPLLVMMMSPRALFVALASDSVALLPFVLLGTFRLGVTDASYFIIGKRFPREITDRPAMPTTSVIRRTLRTLLRKGDRLCRWFCDRPRLAGAFLFFRPNSKYLALSGAYGVNPWVAGISSIAGTATYLTAMHIGIGAIF